jgi:hypothetical protein
MRKIISGIFFFFAGAWELFVVVFWFYRLFADFSVWRLIVSPLYFFLYSIPTILLILIGMRIRKISE